MNYIDMINYFPSKNVLLRPEWVEEILWKSKTVRFPFSKELIKTAPAYIKGEISEKFIVEVDEHFKYELSNDQQNLSHQYTIRNRRSQISKYYEKDIGHVLNSSSSSQTF